MHTRPSSRLIVLNPDNRVLLFHFVFDHGALAGKSLGDAGWGAG